MIEEQESKSRDAISKNKRRQSQGNRRKHKAQSEENFRCEVSSREAKQRHGLEKQKIGEEQETVKDTLIDSF